MAKKTRNPTHPDHNRGTLDASAVADLLDRAESADLKKVGEELGEVKCDLETVKSDVQELKEVVAEQPAPAVPPSDSEPSRGSESEGGTAGSITPVLVNGAPATPEQAKAAHATLAKAARSPLDPSPAKTV